MNSRFASANCDRRISHSPAARQLFTDPASVPTQSNQRRKPLRTFAKPQRSQAMARRGGAAAPSTGFDFPAALADKRPIPRSICQTGLVNARRHRARRPRHRRARLQRASRLLQRRPDSDAAREHPEPCPMGCDPSENHRETAETARGPFRGPEEWRVRSCPPRPRLILAWVNPPFS
jgi:hypothetical protein